MANKTVKATPVDKLPSTSPTLPKNPATIKKLPVQKRNGEAELPVQKPGAGGPVQTMGAAASNIPDAVSDATAQPASDGYTPLNEQVWSGGYDAYKEYVEQQAENLDTDATTPMTEEEYNAWLEQLGVDPSQYATGGYNQDGKGVETPLPGTGEEGWYYDEGVYRPKAEGTSGADEDLLSAEGYGLIQAFKAEWNRLEELAKAAEAAGNTELAAQYRAERDLQNDYANQVRAAAGYYGGTDGSMYIPLGQLGITNETQDYPQDITGAASLAPGTSGGSASAGGTSTGGTSTGITPIDAEIAGLDRIDAAQFKDLLEQWKAAAQEQADGQVDFAVQQAVAELERALEDAQPQFKEQAEGVSLDERQAMDNAALYAQLRGDRGGIGQEQYSSIQNTAAQNRLAVQQAQTKLSTDTARQIEDLRAQGEFEKADKALEITQTYLAQLISLEQWAAEYNLSVDQFNIQLEQWEKEFEMAMLQLEMSQSQWEQEFAFQQEQAAISNYQWEQEFNAALEQWAAEFGLSQQQFNAALEQWAAEFGLSQQQFNAALEQWEQEFGFSQQQFQSALDQWEQEFQFSQQEAATDNSQWQQEFNAALEQWNQEFALTQDKYYNSLAQDGQSQLADVGWAMLEMGITPGEEYLAAMGLNAATAQLMIAQMQEEGAAGAGTAQSSAYKDVLTKAKSYETVEEADRYLAQMVSSGFITEQEKDYIRSVVLGQEEASAAASEGTLSDLDLGSVISLEMGVLSYDEIERMVEMGVLVTFDSGSKVGVKWADGWNRDKYRDFKNNLLFSESYLP